MSDPYAKKAARVVALGRAVDARAAVVRRAALHPNAIGSVPPKVVRALATEQRRFLASLPPMPTPADLPPIDAPRLGPTLDQTHPPIALED